MASKSKAKVHVEEGAIADLIEQLKNTLDRKIWEKAEHEYVRLQRCLKELQTNHAKQYSLMASDKPSKEDINIDQLTISQKDNARGILQLLKTAGGMETLEDVAKKISKAKAELFTLIDAHFILKTINPKFVDSVTEKRPLAELLESDKIKGVKKDIQDKAVAEYNMLVSMAKGATGHGTDIMGWPAFIYDPDCTLNDIKPDFRKSAEQLYTVLNMANVDEYIRKRAIKEFIFLTSGFVKFIIRDVKDLDDEIREMEGSGRKRTNENFEEENIQDQLLETVHGSSSFKHKKHDLEKSLSNEGASWLPPNSRSTSGDQEVSTKWIRPKDSSSSPKQSTRHYFSRSFSTSSAEGEERGLTVEPMRSHRECLVLDQGRSPLKELAISYRENLRVSARGPVSESLGRS